MKHSKWLVWVVLGILVLSVTAEAAEKRSGNRVANFFRGLFNFPAKTTEKSVGVATDAARRGSAIGTGEVKNVGNALTGSREAAVGIVVDPVKGTATTTYETTKGSVTAPVEAAKESFGSQQQE